MSSITRSRHVQHSLKKLTVVVPCFNEEAVIKLFYSRLSEVLLLLRPPAYEIIFVDDGSTDATPKILRSIAMNNTNIVLLRLSRNFGHQNALLAGLSHRTGNAVVTIDADLQDPPELIPELISEWEQGSKVVNAQRRTRAGETWFKLWSASLYYKLVNTLSSVPITADCGDYRLMDGEVAVELCAAAEADPYIRGLVGWLGYSETVVGYDRRSRAAGSTKYTLLRMLAFARQGVLSSSALAQKIPLCMTGVAGFGLILSLLSRSETRLNLWIGVFVNSFILTVMGQYLNLIQRNSGNKPAFIIDEVFGRVPRTAPKRSTHQHEQPEDSGVTA